MPYVKLNGDIGYYPGEEALKKAKIIPVELYKQSQNVIAKRLFDTKLAGYLGSKYMKINNRAKTAKEENDEL